MANQAVISLTLKDAFSMPLLGVGRNATKTFNSMGKSAQKSGTHFRSFFAAFAGVGALAGGVFILGKAMRSIAQETAATEKALVQLDAILRSTGFAAGLNKNEMIAMAKSMGDLGTFTDAAMLKSTGIMATFTKIGKETFPRAMESAMDMSSVFGQSLQQSVVQLGTALNDPIAGVGRLMRIGISFTAQQRQQIEEMMKTNDIMGAQAVIVDELRRELGGAAQAELETFSGQVKKLGANLLSLASNIGEMFTKNEEWTKSLKGVNKMLNKLADTPLDELLLEKLQNLVNGFFDFWNGLETDTKGVILFWANNWATLFVVSKHVLKQIGKIAVAFFDNFSQNTSSLANFFVNIFQATVPVIGVLFAEMSLGIQKTLLFLTSHLNNIQMAVQWLMGEEPTEMPFLTHLRDGVAETTEKLGGLKKEVKDTLSEGVDFSSDFVSAMNFEGVSDEIDKELDAVTKTIGDLFTDEGSERLKQDILGVIDKEKTKRKKEREEKKAADDIFIADFKSAIGGEMNKLVGALTVLGDDMKKLGGEFGKAIIDGGKALEDFIMKGVGQLVSDHFGRQARAESTELFTKRIEGEMASDPEIQKMQSELDAAVAAGNEEVAKSIESAMATKLGDALAATQPVSDFFGGLMGGITGGLTQMLLGKLFGRGKKKAVEKPVPVKVVNWGDMTQELLKSSSRRAVSPMITSPGNAMMSSDFSRDTRF